jgi:hypothetical protein
MTQKFTNKEAKKLKDIIKNKTEIIKKLRAKNKKLITNNESKLDTEQIFVITPKNNRIFTYFFNITDFKKIKVYFTFKRRISANLSLNNLYVNKFNNKTKNNFIKNKKNKRVKDFRKLSSIIGINSILEDNLLKIKSLDTRIFEEISSYDEKLSKDVIDKKDIKLKTLIEEINIRIGNIEKLKNIKLEILDKIINYKPKEYFIKMLCYLELFKKQNEPFDIHLSDALNLLNTTTDDFRKNILSSNLDLESISHNKENHYYFLHLMDYDHELKNHYFADYEKLFSIKLNKPLARLFYTENNKVIADTLSLQDAQCILPIFTKKFNPSFNKIPSSFKYKFNITEQGFRKDNISLTLEDPGSTMFIDAGESYEEEIDLYDSQIKLIKKYISLEEGFNKEFILLSFNNLNNVLIDLLIRNFSNKIKIFEFFNALFEIETEIKEIAISNKDKKSFLEHAKSIISSLEEDDNKNFEKSLILYNKDIGTFDIFIPVYKILHAFWNNFYEINNK